MKKIIIICFFISLGFAGTYDSLAKNSLKFFKPSIIGDIGNKYGEDGIKAFEKLSLKYKDTALDKFNLISKDHEVGRTLGDAIDLQLLKAGSGFRVRIKNF